MEGHGIMVSFRNNTILTLASFITGSEGGDIALCDCILSGIYCLNTLTCFHTGSDKQQWSF